MIPRGKIDLSWTDIASVAVSTLDPRSTQSTEQSLYRHWGHGNSAVCLSVRSGFDALLTSLKLPEGSEIIFSAYTVGDMMEIARAHGLKPVPLDIEIDTLAPDMEELKRLVGDNTRMIVFAHLFGARADIDKLVGFARANNIMMVEDCAQAFTGDAFRGHPGADVSMFSFGPIKTATALGGAMLNFRHTELRDRFAQVVNQYTYQRRLPYLMRVAKYACIKFLSYRSVYTLFVMLCTLLGKSYDNVISGSLRNFSGDELLQQLRQRPCRSLMQLMRRRFKRTGDQHCRRRAALGVETGHILHSFKLPGSRAAFHSYWGFPVMCDEREEVIAHLRKHGYDATTGSSSMKVIQDGRPEGGHNASDIEDMYKNIIFLPVYQGMTMNEISNMTRLLETPATTLKLSSKATA